MTYEEHRRRHIVLHEALDELAADFLVHHNCKLPSTTSLMELMKWSARQTEKPDFLGDGREPHQ